MASTFRDRPQDINRNGRPKKGKTLTDILEKYGSRREFETPEGTVTRKEALARKVWELALEGDVTCIKYIYDRIDGKPEQTMAIDTSPMGIAEILEDVYHEREKLKEADDREG